jgi:hypothetical protein
LYERFLASEGGDRNKALRRCEETLAWRASEKADSVLDEVN